jgi:hypothetical protein
MGRYIANHLEAGLAPRRGAPVTSVLTPTYLPRTTSQLSIAESSRYYSLHGVGKSVPRTFILALTNDLEETR